MTLPKPPLILSRVYSAVTQYIPTRTVEATSENIKNFVSEHDKYIWKIWLPLVLPYLILDHALNYIVFLNFHGDDVGYYYMMVPIFLGNILNAAIIALLAINWHRLVIRGRDEFDLMNLLKPTKNELWFISFAILLSVIELSSTVFTEEIVRTLIPRPFTVGFLIEFSFLFFISYLMYRISFVFPAKAVSVDITFFDAWKLSHGTFWGMVFSVIRASLSLIGLFIIFIVIILVLTFLLPNPVLSIMGYLDDVVMVVYFVPRFMVIGITALSNYYMFAMKQEEKESA